eukprot:GDKI01031619.1.p1 GENE.GDKI01031619.1~~GDKI01031619.1.p1  ORF type:complete len:423 (-),score=94.53 GDKI01031619.1:720-1988(-)
MSSAPEFLVIRGESPNVDEVKSGYTREKAKKSGRPMYKSEPMDEEGEVKYIWFDDDKWWIGDDHNSDDYTAWADDAAPSPDKVKIGAWQFVEEDGSEKKDPNFRIVPFNKPKETKGDSIKDGKFVDKDFPPNQKSLGVKDTECEWVRASRLGDKLWDTIDVRDLMQGEVGDCWLIAAIASIAEFPQAVIDLFETKTLTPDGKYVIRLFDTKKKQWERITIDDFIPCEPCKWWEENPTPLMAQPKGGEIWVLLLEKAFAKWCGSYGRLDGGYSVYAWGAMTGCDDLWLWSRELDGNTWQRSKLLGSLHSQKKSAKQKTKGEDTEDDDKTPPKSSLEMFKLLKQYDESNLLMGAGIESPDVQGDDNDRPDGLVGNPLTHSLGYSSRGTSVLCSCVTPGVTTRSGQVRGGTRVICGKNTPKLHRL